MAENLEDLKQQLAEAENAYAESKSDIASIEKGVRSIVNNMFRQSFGDPNAKDIYTEQIEKTKKLYEQQIKLEKELVDLQTEAQRAELKAHKEKIEHIKKQISEQEKLQKAEEERLNKVKSQIESINKIITGDLAGGITGLLGGKGMWGTAIQTGLQVYNKIDQYSSTNRSLAGQLFGSYDSTALGKLNQMRGTLFGMASLSPESQRDYANYLTSNFNVTDDLDSQRRIAYMRGGVHNAFQGRVSQGAVDELLANAIRRGQISNVGMAGQLQANIASSAAFSGMSDERFVRNLTSLNDVTAQYSVNIETVGGLLKKFGKEVDKGTISLQQLVAVQSGIASASVSQNAGLGALLMQSGNLPTDAYKYVGSPLGLSGWLRNNAFRSDVIRGVESVVGSEADRMGLFDTLERQEYYKMRYSSLGYNISNKQATTLGAGGSLTAEEWKKIQKDGEANEQARQDLLDKSLKYYNNNTTLTQKVEDILQVLTGHAVQKTNEKIEKFMDKEREGLTKSDGSNFVDKVKNTAIDVVNSDFFKKWEKFAHWLNNSSRYLEDKPQVVNVDVTGKVKAEVVTPDTQGTTTEE